jgi:transaldolase
LKTKGLFMLIFLDSADPEEVQQAVESGLIAGVTTNPSLLVQQKDPLGAMKAICQLVPGPVSLQVGAAQASEMVEQGRFLASLGSNVVVKVPLTPEGLKACSLLSHEGIPVNVTLCFSLAQGLLAARAGATYVSPFVGRLEDAGEEPDVLLDHLAQTFSLHNLPTLILAASLRNRHHVEMAALCCAHVATVPYRVFKELWAHPLLTAGLRVFEKDATSLGGLFESGTPEPVLMLS